MNTSCITDHEPRHAPARHTLPASPAFPISPPTDSQRRYTVPSSLPFIPGPPMFISEPDIMLAPIAHDRSRSSGSIFSRSPSAVFSRNDRIKGFGTVELIINHFGGPGSTEPCYAEGDMVSGTLSLRTEQSSRVSYIEVLVQKLKVGRNDTVVGETKMTLREWGHSRFSFELEKSWTFQLAMLSATSSASSVHSATSSISTASEKYDYFLSFLIHRPLLHPQIHITQLLSLNSSTMETSAPLSVPPPLSHSSEPSEDSSLPPVPLAGPPEHIVMTLRRVHSDRKQVQVFCKLEIPATRKVHLPGPIPLRLVLFCEEHDVLALCSASNDIHIKLRKTVAYGEEAIRAKHNPSYGHGQDIATAVWDMDDADVQESEIPQATNSRSKRGWKVIYYGKIDISGLEPTLAYEYGYHRTTGLMVRTYTICMCTLTVKSFTPQLDKNRILLAIPIKIMGMKAEKALPSPSSLTSMFPVQHTQSAPPTTSYYEVEPPHVLPPIPDEHASMFTNLLTSISSVGDGPFP